ASAGRLSRHDVRRRPLRRRHDRARRDAAPARVARAFVRRGPVWGAASDDLNATMLEWPPGEGPAEHVNDSRDGLYVVLAGEATLTLDGKQRLLRSGDALIVGKGVRRALVAGRACAT